MSRSDYPEIKIADTKFKRGLLITAGSVSLSLGIIGIFVPVMPTTSFLLLAAACYVRSSRRLYVWLITNRYFGEYIRNYREKRGIPMKAKVTTISLLWIMISSSAIFAVDVLWVRIMLFGIAVGVTIHVAMIKTYRPEDYPDDAPATSAATAANSDKA